MHVLNTLTSSAVGAAPHAKAHRRRARQRSATDWTLFLGGVALIGWGIYLGATSMSYNWQWYRIPRYIYRVIDGEIIWGPLVKGTLVTLEITLYATLVAFAIGLVTALLRLSRSWSGHLVSTCYLELVRNTPLLVQMYLFYFVLSPIIGIDRFWTGVLCLAVFEAAFISEIIRGGILSVQRGQWEGAMSLGMRPLHVYARVVLPQAVPIMLPPMTSALVNIIKNSAIVSTIALFDLTNEGRNVIADTFLSFEVWFTIAGIYLVLTVSLSILASRLETRARRGYGRD